MRPLQSFRRCFVDDLVCIMESMVQGSCSESGAHPVFLCATELLDFYALSCERKKVTMNEGECQEKLNVREDIGDDQQK